MTTTGKRAESNRPLRTRSNDKWAPWSDVATCPALPACQYAEPIVRDKSAEGAHVTCYRTLSSRSRCERRPDCTPISVSCCFCLSCFFHHKLFLLRSNILIISVFLVTSVTTWDVVMLLTRNTACSDVRVVKEFDSKSNGLCPRRFESCSVRIFCVFYLFFQIKFLKLTASKLKLWIYNQ